MARIRGWVSSWRWVKASIKTHSNTVCSVSDTNTLNPQDRLNSSLAPHTSLLVLFTGSIGPVVDFCGLTDGSRKAIYGSRLGHLHPYFWCAWTVLECSFNILSCKLDFSCCADKDNFCKCNHKYLKLVYSLAP